MKADVPTLSIRGLEVRRDGFSILRSIDWTLRRREHWVLLGPNGSGKTSLLSALTGYLTPSAGVIQVLGETYGQSDWRTLRQKIGLVSSALRQQIEDSVLVLDLVASGPDAVLNPWQKTSERNQQLAHRWLGKMNAQSLAHRCWGVLSQGERQKVLIARALTAQPALLILDEPCAGLDPRAREDFLAQVEALAQNPQGPDLVLVTHHIEEIPAHFTHALLLHQGTVAAAGPLSEILTTKQLIPLFGPHFQVVRRKKAAGYRYTLYLREPLPGRV